MLIGEDRERNDKRRANVCERSSYGIGITRTINIERVKPWSLSKERFLPLVAVSSAASLLLFVLEQKRTPAEHFPECTPNEPCNSPPSLSSRSCSSSNRFPRDSFKLIYLGIIDINRYERYKWTPLRSLFEAIGESFFTSSIFICRTEAARSSSICLSSRLSSRFLLVNNCR